MKDRFNFKLLPSDGGIRQPEINEKFLTDNNFQWLAHTDTLQTKQIKMWDTKSEQKCKYWENSMLEKKYTCRSLTKCSRQTDAGELPGRDWVLQRNISLHRHGLTKTQNGGRRYQGWAYKIVTKLSFYRILDLYKFQMAHQFWALAGQRGSWMSIHSQLSGNLVRETISLLSK